MIRTGGSRLAFSPGVAGALRARVRHRGVRFLTAGLRRSPRSALSPVARDRARSGAVGVESGLVGRISGASVLPARLRVPGRAHSARFRQLDPGRGGVPDDRVDRLPGAWADDVPGAHAGSPERLARAARRVRRAHALRRTQQRRRGRRAHRDARSAAGLGVDPTPAPGARALDRGRRSTFARRGAHRGGDRPHPPGHAAGRGDLDRRRRRGAAAVARAPGRRAARPGVRRRADRVLDRAAAVPPREHAGPRVGRGAHHRRRRRRTGASGSGRARASRWRRAERACRRALSVGDGARRARRPVRARAARSTLASRQSRRGRRVDRVHHGGRPRLVQGPLASPRARDGPRGRARSARSVLAEPAANPDALASGGRLAVASVDRARSETLRSLGRVARGAFGTCPVREVGGAARLRRSGKPGVVSAAHSRHGAGAGVLGARDRQRNLHASLADCRAHISRRRGAGADHSSGRAARRSLALRPRPGHARSRDLQPLRRQARHQCCRRDRRGRRPPEGSRRERCFRQARLPGAVPDLRTPTGGGAAARGRRGPLDDRVRGRPRCLGHDAHGVLSPLARASSGCGGRDATGKLRRSGSATRSRRGHPHDRARLRPRCPRDFGNRGDRRRRPRVRGVPATRESSVDSVDGQSGLLLFAAGLAGGIVTAMVGGASLITFPALLAAGLPAIVANASNTVALTPGNLAAGLADLERMPRWDRSFASLALVSVAGSVAGAALLLATPEKAFTAVVPLLIGFATLLFAMSGRIRLWMLSRTGGAAPSTGWNSLLFAPVAVYGGYFGAGMSVMILAILSVGRADEFRTANVIKNLLSGLTSFVAVVVFVLQGVVAWPPTLVVMAGAVIGGFLGGRLARVLPPDLMRWIVITVGTVLTLIYARRYWLS